MQKNKRSNLIIINIACILALIVVILPLLMIAQYNYPTADDWSFGESGYKALKNGEGFIAVLRMTIETVRNNYVNWEGRFSAVFFASLQPGIWGEQYYFIVTWIMLGAVILSEIFLCKTILTIWGQKENKWLCIPIMIPALILQILYLPYPDESLYWYTGAVNYTFVYGLSLMLIGMYIKLAFQEYSKWKYWIMAVVTCVLAVLVGGNNFATSLSCFLMLLLLSVIFVIFKRKAFFKTWYLTIIMGASLLICVLAPANMQRINSNFDGKTGSAMEAIIMSLVRSFTNMYSWTNIKVVLMFLFILPFVWKAVKSMKVAFPLPGIFTILTFGIYASQATATMYVDGTTGGGRMGAILFYSFYVWVVGNIAYWLGWIGRKQWKFTNLLNKSNGRLEQYILPYVAVVGIVLVGVVYAMDLHELTSYKAYRNYRQGFAQQYAAEWEARLEVLHDDSIKQVIFEPLSVRPEMLLYTDLQRKSGYYWVNDACASYYDKESVDIYETE